MEARIMNVKNKTLAQWKKLFTQELAHLYEKREIESIFERVFESFHWSKIDFLLNLNSEITKEEEDLKSILNQLKKEEPIQYILGYAFFDDLKIPVREGVLIPRQETEELVEWVDLTMPKGAHILDVCTGSGCISLALKDRDQSKQITAIEYSKDALEQVTENKLHLNLNIDVLHLDALSPWNLDKTWDCIVSNPPYIPESDKVRMKNNVLEFEPEMALFVEDSDPLIFYRRIAEEGLIHLNPNGFLFFEIHEDLGPETKALIEQIGYKHVELRKDLNGKDRMIKAQR